MQSFVVSKFISTFVVFLAVIFLFNISYAKAETLSGSTSCVIGSGLSTCRITNLTTDGKPGNYYDLYNTKSGITSTKVFASPSFNYDGGVGQTAAEIGYGMTNLALRLNGIHTDLATLAVSATCKNGAPWVNNACKGMIESDSEESPDDILAQIEQLTEALAAISQAVINSPDIPDSEKLILIKQIVDISTQILILKEILNPVPFVYSVASSTPTPPVPDSEKESAASAHLKGIMVTFDNATDEAEVTLDYSGSKKILNLILPTVIKTSGFNSKMKVLRADLTTELSNSQKIYARDINKLIFISARNPVRDNVIPTNSAVAKDLSENFGLHSVINKITVYPGMNMGSIVLSSDQEELLRADLASNFDTGFYSVYLQYFATTPHDPVDIEGKVILLPKATDGLVNIEKSEVQDVISELFNQIPYSSKIPNFGRKFVDFMTFNYGNFRSSDEIDESYRDCYQKSDEAILNGFISYLVKGIGAQSKDVDSITTYVAPMASLTDEFDFGGCTPSGRIF